MVRKGSLVMAAAALLAVGAAAPAAASEGAGLQGTFDGRSYNTCQNVSDQTPVYPDPGDVTGTWRVNLHDTKATARFVIYVDGALHVAYTAQMERVPEATSTFTATTLTAAGPLTVTLENGALTYTIDDYTDPFGGGFTCESVVYTGEVG